MWASGPAPISTLLNYWGFFFLFNLPTGSSWRLSSVCLSKAGFHLGKATESEIPCTSSFSPQTASTKPPLNTLKPWKHLWVFICSLAGFTGQGHTCFIQLPRCSTTTSAVVVVLNLSLHPLLQTHLIADILACHRFGNCWIESKKYSFNKITKTNPLFKI